MGLRIRVLLLVLVPVIPALILAIHTNLEQQRLGIYKVEKDATRVVQLAVASHLGLIDATRQYLEVLAHLPQARGNDIRGFDTFFSNLLRIYTNYSDFGLIGTNGILIASAFGREGPTNLLLRADFHRTAATKAFSVGVFGPAGENHIPSLYLGCPIVDESSTLVRILYTALNLAALSNATAKVELPPGAVIDVFDLDGTILSHQPQDGKWVGRNFGAAPLLEAIRRKTEGTSEVAGLDDVKRLYAYTAIRIGPDPGLFVAVGIPKAVAFAELRSKLYRNLGILGLVAAAAIVTAWSYANRYILAPVRALCSISRQVASGNLEARASTSEASGEIRELARAFDEMTTALQRQRSAMNDSQNALRQNEERVRLVLDNAMDAVITIDIMGTITSWNKEAERTFGWTQEEIAGRSLAATIIPERHRAEHERGLEQYRATGQGPVLNKRIEITALRKDGTEIPVELSIAPIRFGDTIMFSGFVRDITERKQAEAGIRKLNETLERRVKERTAELERLNKELESFSYSVSHDLRAPLRRIVSFIDLLRRDTTSALSESGDQYFGLVAKSARQMDTLINDLLSFSQMSRAEMFKRDVNLCDLIPEILKEMAKETEGRNIRWEIEPLPAVHGDRAMLKQVWVNLLSNAIKYTRKKDEAVIHIQSRNQADEIEFQIRDNGAGFDMKHAGKLFGVFQRLHHADEFEGTGIGLANVQRIIQRHGGRIWAQSKPDEGASFYFTLPKPNIG